MSHKIIKPEGIELIEYLNNGYAICNRCGAVMRQTEDPKTGCGVYICPLCGLKVDEEDYEYESDEEVEWTEEMLDMEQGDIPPAGCRACGGPYPYKYFGKDANKIGMAVEQFIIYNWSVNS